MKPGESSSLVSQPNSMFASPVHASDDLEAGNIAAYSNIYELKTRPRRDICESDCAESHLSH